MLYRGYLAFLNSPLVANNDALPFIPYVPSAMRQIVAGIEAGLAPFFPPASVPYAAVSQWGRALYGYPNPEDPTSPLFANWLHVYQGYSYAAASAVLTDPQSTILLDMFQGNPALDTPA